MKLLGREARSSYSYRPYRQAAHKNYLKIGTFFICKSIYLWTPFHNGMDLFVGDLLVVSGDTRPCENLEREVDGADVAVLECTLGKKRKTITIGHMTRSEAEKLGRKARELILIHRKMNIKN